MRKAEIDEAVYELEQFYSKKQEEFIYTNLYRNYYVQTN